jgi:hypothetical protein
MEFFKLFKEIYNKIHIEKEFVKLIPPPEEDWIHFQKKIEKFSEEKKEWIYKMILHYSFLQDKKLNSLPYTLKQKGNDIHIPYSELPYPLQYMILEL